jgi:hypothetical protein
VPDEYAAIINDARSAIADGRQPDAMGLEARIRSVAGAPAAEEQALRQLERVLSVHRARSAIARPPEPPPPPRRAAYRARPTLSGNMDVRRERRGDAFVLSWDAAPGVSEWEVRISARPDARRDYAERETLTRAPNETSLELELGELPVRVHVLGRARNGRLVRRAVLSGLTRESWGDRLERRASAS